MNRERALELINANVRNQNLVKHMLATEAIMRALARRLGGDEEAWGLAGLLHDVDYELTGDDPAKHALAGAEMLAALGVDAAIVYAVKVHNEALGDPRITPMDKALFAGEALTGLITAAALVRPDRKLASVTAQSVLKRFGEKAFARGASRENIATCSDLGIDLPEFVEIGLAAMQGIADDLGL
ncbi:MAG: HDIG domain-containing protein [Chloroflexi bacterium]|nr:HDIG domain-containing protein [Chloroflexota bacterium]MDA8188683.1 HDIG domain-containing protein [Dehalococcoidales bacterium]